MTDEQILAFINEFGHIDETGDVKRNKFVLWAKKGNETTWTPIGYKQESASISNNYDSSTITDILGNKYTDINDKDEQIEMSEYHINPSASEFLDKAFALTLAGMEQELNDYQLLMECKWLVNEDDEELGRLVTGVTLQLDNLGGQSFTMADVTWSGISRGDMGTVTFTNGQPDFTPAS